MYPFPFLLFTEHNYSRGNALIYTCFVRPPQVVLYLHSLSVTAIFTYCQHCCPAAAASLTLSSRATSTTCASDSNAPNSENNDSL